MFRIVMLKNGVKCDFKNFYFKLHIPGFGLQVASCDHGFATSGYNNQKARLNPELNDVM